MKDRSNLRLSEAARMRPGQRVVFNPNGLDCPNKNPKMLEGLEAGASYELAEISCFGFKRESQIPEALSLVDLDRALLTNQYGKPLTNVSFLLKGIANSRCYCYFRTA